MSTGRNTATRNKHRRIIARDRPPCHICGNDIDYDLPHTDPWSYTVDHVTPLVATGPAGDVLDNKQAAHRTCNRAKSDTLPGALVSTVSFVTDRNWWS